MSGVDSLVDARVVETLVWISGLAYVALSVTAGIALVVKQLSAAREPIHVPDEPPLTDPPYAMVPPNPRLVDLFDSVLGVAGRALLLGTSGSGKTTFGIEMCRRLRRLNGQSPIHKVPVFIPLSQARRSNGLATMFIEQVSLKLAGDSTKNPRKRAKKLLKRGSLLLVLDDLDYMDRIAHKELEAFINSSNNSFFCIMTAKPGYRFLEDFGCITMPEWEENDIEKYIHIRVGIASKKRTVKSVHLVSCFGARSQRAKHNSVRYESAGDCKKLRCNRRWHF